MSALTEWEFSPRKAHNHSEPINVVTKDLASSLRMSGVSCVKASSGQTDLQASGQVSSHQMSPSGPQLQDIQGVKHSYVQCMKGRYLSLSLHLRDATVGLPLFSGIQHFRHSSLDRKRCVNVYMLKTASPHGVRPGS